MPDDLGQLGFILACLVIPIVWGWLVNWIFLRLRPRRPRQDKRKQPTRADETFIDYQI